MLKTELDKHITHISFHTPGHNGGVSVLDGREEGTTFDTRYDVTELSYTDNLLESDGVLKELEQRAAKAFGADELFLFTNGATGAVFAAIAAVEGKIAVVGSAHVSVFRALTLFRKHGVYCRDFAALQKYLSDCESGNAEKVSAIFITSPDYLGNIENLSAYRAAADAANAMLIVDSSHGSHFAFCKKLPIRATEYGDMVIYSLHKTLPVLTGGAALAVKSEWTDAAFDARRMTHTTSPSYPILLSVESALEKLESGEEDYESVLKTIELFREDLRGTGFRVLANDDPTRLVIASERDGASLAAALEERGIYAEYSFGNSVVFIVTPYNKQYLSFLAETLKTVSETRGRTSETTRRAEEEQYCERAIYNVKNTMEICRRNPDCEQADCDEKNERNRTETLCDAVREEKNGNVFRKVDCGNVVRESTGIRELVPQEGSSEVVPIENAEGRVLFAPIGLYPPGVPTFFAGDVLDRNAIQLIGKNRTRMFGLARKGVSVVK